MVAIEVIVELVLDWIKRSARSQRPAQDVTTTVFGLCWQMKALVIVICGCFSIFIWLVINASVAGESWYIKPGVALGVCVVPTAILMLLPGSVVTTTLDIRQRRWWRKETQIAWADVVSTREDPDGNVFAQTNSGPQILFSPYLVGQPQFMLDLTRYSASVKVGGR